MHGFEQTDRPPVIIGFVKRFEVEAGGFCVKTGKKK
jgi:hypothetical protein